MSFFTQLSTLQHRLNVFLEGDRNDDRLKEIKADLVSFLCLREPQSNPMVQPQFIEKASAEIMLQVMNELQEQENKKGETNNTVSKLCFFMMIYDFHQKMFKRHTVNSKHQIQKKKTKTKHT
jgi:hypothetical protein